MTGIGTTTLKERMLATQVRQLSLSLIHKYLEDESDENKKFRQDLILKLATNILPRKTEIGGDKDNPTPIQIYAGKSLTGVPGYQSDPEDLRSE